jgi:hypothetical protein
VFQLTGSKLNPYVYIVTTLLYLLNDDRCNCFVLS